MTTAALNQKPCVIPDCRSPALLNAEFCPDHYTEWRRSHEYHRADDRRSRSMLADFVRRVVSERHAR